MRLLERVVVPLRLALIYRSGTTLAYNPALNRWDLLDPAAAEVLRWLRAGRARDGLVGHLGDVLSVPHPVAAERLQDLLRWLLLRRMLYLDAVPEIAEPTPVENPLSVVYWICTQACNLRCTYCYQSAAVAHRDELTTAEALELVDQIVETGAVAMVFTGGEPFTRADLLEIADYARSVGLTTNLITNGSHITADNIDAVAARFVNVTISLDHGLPEHHDCTRGEGSWAEAVRAIDLLLEAGVNVDVNSVLSHFGLPDIEHLLEFVRQRPIGAHRIIPQFPMGRGRGAAVRRGELTEEELLELNDRLAALHRAATRSTATRTAPEGTYGTRQTRRDHCGAGLSEVSVDPRGWVYPCKLLQYPEFRTHNVRDHRLAEIVATHPALATIRARVTATLQPCRTCIIRHHCGGGCRGIHYSFTHDYIKAHPLFCAYLRRTFESQAWTAVGAHPPSRASSFEYTEPAVDDQTGGSGRRTFVPLSAVRRAARTPVDRPHSEPAPEGTPP